jgi:hypothetical protein
VEVSYTTFVLYHYGRRYIERFAEMPDKRDLDPVLARTLLSTCGDIGNVISVLEAWFDSPDPWYANEGFELRKCFTVMNRLFAQGEIEPRAGGTPDQQRLSRELAAALYLKPELRLVRPERNVTR